MKFAVSVLLLTSTLVLIAAAAAPRYLEELRIGGGFGDAKDGGADITADGSIALDGDLTVGGGAEFGDITLGGGDIFSPLTALRLDPAGAGLFRVDTSLLWVENSGGALWLVNPSASNANVQARLKDSGGNYEGFGALWFLADDSTDGSEDGMIKFSAMRNGVLDYDIARIDSTGNITMDGDLNAKGGDVTAGTSASVRGVATLWHGSGGNAPGSLKLASPNGTIWYVFVEDDGTLKVHGALPAANSDGAVVGSQS